MKILKHLRSFSFNVFMVVVAASLTMACAGGTYLFGSYSQLIKTTFDYDQKTIALIALWKDIGGNALGLLFGLLHDKVKAGPKLCLILCLVLNLGYLIPWSGVKGNHEVKLWHMCVGICLGSCSQAIACTLVQSRIVETFPPANRGLLVGGIMAFNGLSAALFHVISKAFWKDDPASIIALIAFIPSAVDLCLYLAYRFVCRYEEHNEESDKIRWYLLFWVGLLIVYVLPVSFFQNLLELGQLANKLVAAGMVIILVLPLSVVCYNYSQRNKGKVLPLPPREMNDLEAMQRGTEVVQSESWPKLGEAVAPREMNDPAEAMQREKEVVQSETWPKLGEDHNIREAMATPEMWLLNLATGFGVGAAFAATNNVGLLTASLHYKQSQTSLIVSIISFCNCFGRISSGILSDNFPRPLVCAVFSSFALLGHFFIAWNFPGAVYLGFGLIGTFIGAHWTTASTTISDLFGVTYWGTFYNFLGVPIVGGSYFLSLVVGKLYDEEAQKQNPHVMSGSSSCLGVKCFQNSFYITGAVSLVATISYCILAIRTKKLYKKPQ